MGQENRQASLQCNCLAMQQSKRYLWKNKKAGYENCIAAKSGLKLSPYYPAGKMTWFMENVPDVDKKADDGDAAFGTIDSWLVYKLTKGKVIKPIIQMPVVPSF